MKLLLTLALTGAALLAQTPPPAKSPAAPKTGTASKTGAAPRPNPLLNPAALKAISPATFKTKFTTTAGDFVVEVHREWAPIGADRFYNLVRNRFFVGNAFFRIVPNFIVQFGLSGDPAVNHAWDKATIKDDPVKQHNTRGTVVYAKPDAPNARTTQLFINLRDNTGSLDPQGFAPFGTVIEGMDVVDKFYQGYGERPDQGMITDQGKAYLDKNFPNLTRITATAIITEPGAAAPAATKTGAPPAATKTGAPPAATKKQ
jgi:cyclophilin family peptidyl-prolyl cis-trans isomerase